MNANKLPADQLADLLDEIPVGDFESLDHHHFTRQAATMLRQQQQLIDVLNGRIERMIEKQSHYEAMAHAGGFEVGRQQGMKQERALWELAASTQEIMNERK